MPNSAPFYQHPAFVILLSAALMLWPIMRLYKRVGLSPLWAFGIFASILVPFLGPLLVAAPIAVEKWPQFPAAAPPRKPLKTPI
jgi:hypothetical protein